MKKLFIIAAALTLFGCKSTKNADCDAYGKNQKLHFGTSKTRTNCIEYTDCVICVDSIKCDPIHVHFYYHNEGSWSCLSIPDTHYVSIDTFYFEETKFHPDVKN
jgi:hypothetical protein